jgi:putative transposase
MPEHLHVVIEGMTERSSAWDAIVRFKQRTGYWLRQNTVCEWQKDFYDHVIRRHESFPRHIRYVVDNPVRRGLVATWEEYAYTGSIGVDLKEILSDIALT